MVIDLLLAIITSAIGTILFQKGTILIGPQKASLLSTFEPLTSVIIGVTVFNEKLGLSSIIGIIFILISVVLLGIYDR